METELEKKIEACLSDLEDIIGYAKEIRADYYTRSTEGESCWSALVDDCLALYKRIEQL